MSGAHITYVVGTRPNFMKVAPLLAAGHAWGAGSARNSSVWIGRQTLIHTGQHYDASMSEVFFEQLGLPKPDLNLGIGSGSQGHQTGQMLMALEDALIDDRPEMLVCVGDVNSTLAAALAAASYSHRARRGRFAQS
jgi:UDP-N-acetylglucosamine 2-epimerase (non-hydrolysing)